MALFRNFGVNHVFGVTGLESLVRRTRVRLRAIHLISLKLAKNCLFRVNLKLNYALIETADEHKLSEFQLFKTVYFLVEHTLSFSQLFFSCDSKYQNRLKQINS